MISSVEESGGVYTTFQPSQLPDSVELLGKEHNGMLEGIKQLDGQIATALVQRTTMVLMAEALSAKIDSIIARRENPDPNQLKFEFDSEVGSDSSN
jgi:hypothetical protein